MTGRRRPAERRWGLITATGLFTVIPVPPRDEITSSDAEAAINWLPALGALIGSAAGVLGWLTFWFGGSPFLGAVVCVGLFALITGGLHLDGLADTMDALASRKPREAALAIMKRSDIGPMGVLAILFAVLFQVAGVTHVLAVGSLGQVIAVCALAGVIGRLAVVGACAGPNSARSGGFGDIFVGVMSPIQVGAISLAAAFAVVAAATVWTNPVGFYAAALISVAVVAIQHRRLSKRFGGMTGDLFGCLIESGQTFVIVFACLSI
ncbi:MAG: adenosylcobinamide-GDP ribazoletransferase [Propionibacteriales bacterium]|nr:MAG: adenosylcobinamide-GDP ribazoletransferase [Propionibacteriales bacterium]